MSKTNLVETKVLQRELVENKSVTVNIRRMKYELAFDMFEESLIRYFFCHISKRSPFRTLHIITYNGTKQIYDVLRALIRMLIDMPNYIIKLICQQSVSDRRGDYITN